MTRPTDRSSETLESASPQDGIAAVDAAAGAAQAWASRAPRERAEILRNAYELMTERLDEIAEAIVREMGKPFVEARGEAGYAAEFLRWFSEEAVRVDGEYGVAPAGTNRMLVGHAPIGVSLLITPWNFPAAMATRKIGPALAAGCTVVLKPAEETPLTALLIVDILREAGVPEGVVNVVVTDDPGPLCEAILADPRVRKLSFTGSTAVGRHLLGLAARSVISTSMELGGNAPFIVLEDADLDVAVREAMAAKMRNGGEACTAANRFLVHESVAEDFAARLTEAMSAVRVAPGFEEGAQLGPLINAAALEKVERLVSDAVTRGARVRCGGERLPGEGYFYRAHGARQRPTRQRAAARGDLRAGGADHDVHVRGRGRADGQRHRIRARGLRLQPRPAAAMAIGERIETGMVGLNRGVVSDPAAPFGGAKQSGLGREGGHHGLMEFLEPKYFAFD